MSAGPRRGGHPRTRKQREARHKKEHPGTKLPKKGTGLRRG